MTPKKVCKCASPRDQGYKDTLLDGECVCGGQIASPQPQAPEAPKSEPDTLRLSALELISALNASANKENILGKPDWTERRDKAAQFHRGQSTDDGTDDAMFSFKAGYDAGFKDGKSSK